MNANLIPVLGRHLAAILGFAIFALPMCGAAPAAGATYYVAQKDPKAADSNPGTAELPWKDLWFAMQQLGAGDTLLVKAGHYYRHTGKRYEGGFHTARGGTAEQPITIRAERGEEVVVMGGPTTTTPPGDFTNPAISAGGNYVIIDGFRIYGCASLWKVRGCIIRNCEIWGGNDSEFNCCIRMEYAEACLISNNIVHDVDPRKPSGGTGGNPGNQPLLMAYDIADCVIEHNEFYNASGGGMALCLKDNPRNITVRFNLFWGRGGGAMGSIQHTGENVVIRNNVFRDLSLAGILAHCSLNGMQVCNNTFRNCRTDIRTWTGGTKNIRIYNNIFTHSDEGQLYMEVEPVGGEANRDGALPHVTFLDFNCYCGPADWVVAYRKVARSLDAWRAYGTYGFDKQSFYGDPKFRDAAKGDFRLADDSPCLRSGKDKAAIGAYETGAEQIGIDPAANPWAGNRVQPKWE